MTLKEIQEAIRQVDIQRSDRTLSKDQVELLEMSAVALRDAERLAIEKKQKTAVKSYEERVEALNLLSKQIRARVTNMNKLPKTLDKIESVIKTVVKILSAVAKWN